MGTQTKKSYPSRLRASTTQYKISKEVSKQLNSVAENKFVGKVGDCLAPVSKPAGTQPINYCLFNTGETLPTGVSTNFAPMSCFTYAQAEREGRYLYLKHATMSFEIQMLPRNTTSDAVLNSTTQFRFMVVKQKQYANRLGTVVSPNTSLFLAPDNKEFGLTNTTATNQMYNGQPINRRNWMVYRDQRFTLSAPASLYQTSTGNENAVDITHEKYPVKN